ncbi:MAG: Crp/Fnr family transcriptional regulator [Anaerolineae bacterium]|jgi:CRP/FNR family transcriptional regulator/CRP/FNR family cyclic AMP-dependent transcriptional regulator
MSKIAILRNVELFASLPDHDLEALAASLGTRTFAKGMIIFHQDSPGRTLYIIESGQVRIFLLSESGQETTLNIYGRGEVFGEFSLLDGLPRSAGAVALEKTVTRTLDRADFLRHLESCPQMAISIIEVLTTRLRFTTEQTKSLAFLDIYGRVAMRLLDLASRYGTEKEGIELNLHLTQAELASWVAATRESVNKVLGVFREQRLITVEGQTITILDPEGLKERITY